jgi:hypothetical protein
MYCSSCGFQTSLGTCPACANAIGAVQSTRSSLKHGAAQILIGCAFASVVSLQRGFLGAILWPQSTGRFVGVLFLPIVVALLVSRKSRDWRKFGNYFLALTFLIAGLAVSGRKSQETAEEKIGRIMTEALKGEVAHSSDPQEEAVRIVFREFFTTARSIGKKYDRIELSHIYAAESYKSTEVINRQIQALENVISVNEEAREMYASFPGLMDRKLMNAGIPSTVTKKFSEGATESFQRHSVPMLNYLDAEKIWAIETINLYRFARDNQNFVIVDNERLAISNNDVRARFNSLLDRSSTLRDKMIAADKNRSAAVDASLSKFHLTQADLKK